MKQKDFCDIIAVAARETAAVVSDPSIEGITPPANMPVTYSQVGFVGRENGEEVKRKSMKIKIRCVILN